MDLLLDEVRDRVPGVVVERLEVRWAADDDNVWWVRGERGDEVQVDSAPGGDPPFLLEHDQRGRLETAEVGSAADTVCSWLAPCQ